MGVERETNILAKTKTNTIKVKKGQRDSTVIAKIFRDLDEGTDASGWSALVTWSQGNIKDAKIWGADLLEIVKEVKRLVNEGLIELMGRVQEVDVILKMPLKDHKITVTFKEAMRYV